MLRLGIISDIHAHRQDHCKEVSALIKYINARPEPDLLVLAGDISHRTPEISKFLSQINLPCEKGWVPGNHDIYAMIQFALKGFCLRPTHLDIHINTQQLYMDI